MMASSISKKQLREFGLLIGFGFPILIGWILPLIGGHLFRTWTLWIGIPSLILGILNPRILSYPYKVWMKLGHALGWINSRIILGLISPDSGKIYKKDNLKIGYLPQKVNVNPILPLSVGRIMNLTGNYNLKNIKATLDETGVSSLINKQLSHISGGEFQRVMLSRALLRDPDLLVLDEPVKEVDYLGQSELYKLIGKLSKERGCGILMVSHDIHVVMASTNRVICLNQHICCEGQVEDVSRHPEYLRLFGLESDSVLAVYSHHHDHTHNN